MLNTMCVTNCECQKIKFRSFFDLNLKCFFKKKRVYLNGSLIECLCSCINLMSRLSSFMIAIVGHFSL